MATYAKHPSQQQQQVFINFRGVELRTNFLSHLFRALRSDGVNVHIENDEVKGVDIETVFTRIEKSRIALVIFSSRYTESRWCLEVLVKIKERVEQGKLVAVPIFYKLNPSEVKGLEGDFGLNLWDQVKRTSKFDELQKWKEALDFFTQKSGLVSTAYRDEVAFITDIITHVNKYLAMEQIEDSHFQLSEKQKDAFVGTPFSRSDELKSVEAESDLNPEEVERVQSEATFYGESRRDDDLNLTKDENFLGEANSDANSNTQNSVENKRLVDPVNEEKKQGKVGNDEHSRQGPQVFINFRGTELRYNFISHLLNALEMNGVNVFIDVHERKGSEIGKLFQRIEESRIALVVFSSRYIESRWCLEELAKINECMENRELLVIPIFYKVKPSDVAKLKGEFGVKFWNSWRVYRDHHLIRWKEALKSISSIKGIDLNQHGSEVEFITLIVNEVLKSISRLGGEQPYVFPYTDKGKSTGLPTGKGEHHETYIFKDHFFGMEERMEQLEMKLEFDCNETRIVGVVGLPGIGKTTLARTLYEKWNCKFIRCVPLLGIREKSKDYGPAWLRQTILEVLLEGKFPVSNETTHESVKVELLKTKIFAVLDDVSDKKQLDFLLGDLDWIKRGSKIVITTCDKSLLEGFAHDTYVVPLLNDEDSFQLFSYNAFGGQICSPTGAFETLSKKFVDYAQGHPLALNILGMELCGHDQTYWKRKLMEMTKSPSMEIQDVRRISTDQLNVQQKDAFLDILFFFKSEDEYFVRSLLDSGDSDSTGAVSEVRDLANKCLITISDGRVEVNDLLHTFGGEDLSSPERQWLWNYKDITDKLTEMEKSDANNVRGLFLDMSEVTKNIALKRMTFTNMLNLRYLKIYDSCCPRQCKAKGSLQFHDGVDFPLQKVRYLHWLKFPLNELPPDFRPENLVDLRLPYSKIERVWEGVKDTPRLKWVDLSHSSKLLNLSSLSKAEKLQRLNLEGCTVLDELPTEIQNMKSLVFLNLRGCIRLSYLPEINLISLKTLILSGCANLEEFKLVSESLVVLHLDGTAIKRLPATIKRLQRLVLLNLKNCKMLKSLPNCIGELKALEELILSGCSRLTNVSEVKDSMKHIRSLLIDRIGAKEMPIISCVGVLDGQAYADIALQSFGPKEWPRGVNAVCSLRRLCLSGNVFVCLQTEIGKLYNLNWLEVKQCKMLTSIPMLPPNLNYFNAHGCDSLEGVANPLALPALSEKIHATFIFSNCNKLNQDAKDNIISYIRWRSQLVLEALFRHNGGSVLEDFTGICFPGWEVPAWFSLHASGSVLKSKLPPHLCDNRFTGIALCAVISFPGYHEQKNTLVVKCNCVIINEDGSCIRSSYTIGSWSKSSYRPGKIDTSHVFVGYTSLLDFQKHGEEEDEEGCSHMEASFEFQVTDGTEVLEGYEVLKCGFNLVYVTDERENINWDAKTGLIPEKIKNIPDEATSSGIASSQDDIPYESYSGLTSGRDETFFSEAKSDGTPNLRKSFKNKKVDLVNDENDTGGDIMVSSYHDNTSLGNFEKIERHPFVGLELRLKQLEKVLYSTPGNTRIVGILGMPGIGKTTLGKYLYAKRGCRYPRHLFLPMSTVCRLKQLRRVFLKQLLKDVNQDVNEETTHESMKDRLLQTKVFVVLDDVRDRKQLDFLLGDLDWIKKGSKIVITTYDKSLLKGWVHDTYVVPQLNNNEAFQILTYHAFNSQILPTETFLRLSRMLVDNVGGNPLDLESLGRVLCGKNESHWQYELLKVRKSFNMKMTDIWRFNIHQLNEQQKDLFLDIVYFSKSKEEYFVRSILDRESPEAVSVLSDLADKFLITISGGRVEMHDQLYSLAKDLGLPGRHRLCNYRDIDNLTKMKQQEANNVRGIFLDMSEITENIALECMTFADMRNLLYLKIYNSCCHRHCKSDSNLYFPDGLDFPLEKVRYLHWVKFPLLELPADFTPENLVDLRLPYSKIERVWEGVKDTPRLKWVDLRHSSKLLDLSALSRAENLQRLNLEGCTSLNELPVEIQNMKSLLFLNLRGCTRLWYLPKMNLISLKTLILSDCSNLKKFQIISESVEFLHLDGTAIKGLPPAIQNLQRLVVLDLKNCKMLECLPNSLGNLKFLDELILSGCSRLKNLPETRNSLKHLQILLFDGTGASEMPNISCFTGSENPSDIFLPPFGSYSTMREWPCVIEVSSLRHLCLSGNDFVSLQPDIRKLQNLKRLDVKQCKKLRFVPTLPPRLQYFDAHGCESLERVANPLALPLLSEQIQAKFNFSNCNKLDEDAKDSIISYTRWRSQLVLDEVTRYNKGSILEAFTRTCFPGWIVPGWFSHRALGPVLKPKLPPHWSDDRLTGIALCAVISFPGHNKQRNRLSVKCNCVFNNEDDSRTRFSCIIGGWSGSSNTLGKNESSHVFIGYTSTLDIKELGEEANEEGCCQTEALFEFQVTDGTEVLEGCEVLKCGFSLYHPTDELPVNSSVRAPVEANHYISCSENGRESYAGPSVVDTRLSGESQQHSTDHVHIPAVASSSKAELGRSHSQIFVSFHGRELRRTFVRHLVSALTVAGINVSTQNDKRNVRNLQSFYKKMEESKIAVAIFSERYIESHFCLNEIVAMEKLAKKGKLLVIPVFYNVRPSDVKNLKGEFGRRFKEMRVRYMDEPEKVLKWETSVKSIAKTIGIHSELYSTDASLVEATVEAVQRELTKTSEGNWMSLRWSLWMLWVSSRWTTLPSFLRLFYWVSSCILFISLLKIIFWSSNWLLGFLVVIVVLFYRYHLKNFGWRDQKKQSPVTISPPAQSDNISRKWFDSVVFVRSTKEPEMRRESSTTRVFDYSASSISDDSIAIDNLPKKETHIATQISNSTPYPCTSGCERNGMQCVIN